jgi:hypothetical protein
VKAETPDGIEAKNPRIMIYPSSRVLKSEEIQIVSERINDFYQTGLRTASRFRHHLE